MARLQIRVEGQLGEISVEAFATVLQETLSILRDLDIGVSHQRGGTIRWTVADLRPGSAVLEADSRVITGDADYGPEIAERFTRGLDIASHEQVTPPYFSTENIRSILKMVQTISRDGARGVSFRRPESETVSELSVASEPTIRGLIGVHRKAIGAVEGTIELVSLHSASRRFNIYEARTQKAVRCNLSQALESPVIEAMREHRRAVVSGLISYNVKGEPIRVDVDRPIRILRLDSDLPTIDQTSGFAPDFSDELTTEQHIRSLRDG